MARGIMKKLATVLAVVVVTTTLASDYNSIGARASEEVLEVVSGEVAPEALSDLDESGDGELEETFEEEIEIEGTEEGTDTENEEDSEKKEESEEQEGEEAGAVDETSVPENVDPADEEPVSEETEEVEKKAEDPATNETPAGEQGSEEVPADVPEEEKTEIPEMKTPLAATASFDALSEAPEETIDDAMTSVIVYATSNNNDKLKELLGLDTVKSSGYAPIGVVELPVSLFYEKSAKHKKLSSLSDDEKQTVEDAFSNLNCSENALNTNIGNNINAYGFIFEYSKSELTYYSGKPADTFFTSDYQECRYHLDVYFNVDKIREAVRNVRGSLKAEPVDVELSLRKYGDPRPVDGNGQDYIHYWGLTRHWKDNALDLDKDTEHASALILEDQLANLDTDDCTDNGAIIDKNKEKYPYYYNATVNNGEEYSVSKIFKLNVPDGLQKKITAAIAKGDCGPEFKEAGKTYDDIHWYVYKIQNDNGKVYHIDGEIDMTEPETPPEKKILNIQLKVTEDGNHEKTVKYDGAEQSVSTEIDVEITSAEEKTEETVAEGIKTVAGAIGSAVLGFAGKASLKAQAAEGEEIKKTVTYDGVEYTIEGLSLEGTGRGTDVGDYYVYLKADNITVWAKGKNVTEDFEIKTPEFHDDKRVVGILHVIPRDVVMVSPSASKAYDGTPLTAKDITESGDGFVKADGAVYDVTGTQTEVGTSNNTFTYAFNSETNPNNYVVTTSVGKLTVTPLPDEDSKKNNKSKKKSSKTHSEGSSDNADSSDSSSVSVSNTSNDQAAVLGVKREVVEAAVEEAAVLGARRGSTEDTTNSARIIILLLAASAASVLLALGKKKEKKSE